MKHKKKSLTQVCSWIASLTVLLGSIYPFYETYTTVSHAPRLSQDMDDTRADVDDLGWFKDSQEQTNENLQEQLNEIKQQMKGK